MSTMTMKTAFLKTTLPLVAAAGFASLSAIAYAAAPGIQGPTFTLTAAPAYLSQPDGQSIYSWGYGCADGSNPTYVPAAITTGFCNTMQVPGPTLVVTEGDPVSVTLTNNLPPAAGNTSILFPGITVTTSCDDATPSGQQGLITCEATHGNSVIYKFTAPSPGTRSYYSGTQGDLQIEMGLYGAIIVLPKSAPAACTGTNTNLYGKRDYGTKAGIVGFPESNFRLSTAAYDNPKTCYDREYLFQFSEMDPRIHTAALAQVTALGNCTAGNPNCNLQIPTQPYHPAYFMINGRSMPDDMDPNYAQVYPHQPYNGNPHMHPGELVLLRIIGQGRWQHPFHEHANHVRILGRDGNLIVSNDNPDPSKASLAGPALFTTTTTPGLAMDGIFYYTGKGLNWDMYGHLAGASDGTPATLPCTPDANGYNTGDAAALNYYEWCQDHTKPLQKSPTGNVTADGNAPVSLPDPNIMVNGAWYGGSPYLGPDATTRAVGPTGSTPPSGTIANSPGGEAGFAFMWHSHNEREITTNNAFPGGMMMMMLVDSREFAIDESN